MGQTPELTVDALVCASDRQVSSDLTGETVLLSLDTARYFGLPGVGARIWHLLQAPVQISEVCSVIADEYEVNPRQCEADTLGFLRQLLAKGLIEVRIAG